MEKREKIAQMQILDQEIAQKTCNSGQIMICIYTKLLTAECSKYSVSTVLIALIAQYQ